MHVTRAAKRHSIVADILVAAVYGERTGEWTARKLRGMHGVSSGRMHMEGNEIVGAAGICHLCLICDVPSCSSTPSSAVIRIFFLPSYLRLFLPPFAANHAHCTHYPF